MLRLRMTLAVSLCLLIGNGFQQLTVEVFTELVDFVAFR